MLAEGFRLQYRVLRCAAETFNDVFVLGTRNAVPLRLSSFCRRFIPLVGTRFSDGDDRRINQVCDEFGITFVLPSCLASTRFLARHRHLINASCFPVPSPEVFDQLDDKWRFVALCGELNVPHPSTQCFATRDDLLAAAASGEAPMPAVVKPLAMWGSAGVLKIEATDEIDKLEIDYQPILLQAFFPGRDLSAFYCCRQGEVASSAIYCKTSRELEFMKNASIDQHARRIIGWLGYDGVLGFDVRQADDGSIAFIECNPRFWYNMNLVMIAGLNFVAIGSDESVSAGDHPNDLTAESVTRPWALLGKLSTPWTLTASDWNALSHHLRDPLPIACMAIQRLMGLYDIANGLQL
ncbi:ATP-grasp domain-containing protein [Hansschlegelia zhihuaiae]|uniref:ATP-grasp domain-containing protein n=1 Tax=Hansschlegelia zhihuaiae TaxID=405005 RepID=UPI0013E8E450|nr:ATP-grasp domain-containing protein [Hansschlegelia zhihuaiae]